MRRIISVAMVAVFMFGLGGSVLADNFNTISHRGWNFKISSPWGLNEHNHQVVSSDNGHPVRYGKQSERFDVRPGDCGSNKDYDNCENDRERSEMTSLDDLRYYSGDEYWYRISLFIPKGHTNLYPVKVSYAQFKGLGCHPVFKLNERNYGSGPPDSSGELVLKIPHSRHYPNARSTYVLTTDYVDKWLDFVINVKWSSGDDGWLKIWINKELKLDYQGKTTHCPKGVYVKYGVYRAFVSRWGRAKSTGTVAYYDGIRISRTREEMFEELAE